MTSDNGFGDYLLAGAVVTVASGGISQFVLGFDSLPVEGLVFGILASYVGAAYLLGEKNSEITEVQRKLWDLKYAEENDVGDSKPSMTPVAKENGEVELQRAGEQL